MKKIGLLLMLTALLCASCGGGGGSSSVTPVGGTTSGTTTGDTSGTTGGGTIYSGTVSGIVRDQNGASLSNVLVVIGSKSTMSSTSGAFALQNIASGTQQIEFIKGGYQYSKQTISVQGGVNNTLSLQTCTLVADSDSGNNPMLVNAEISPVSGPPGSRITLTVDVTSQNNSNLQIIIYSPSINASYVPTDDGLNGDQTALDGTFTYSFALPNTISIGAHAFYFVAVDVQTNNVSSIATASFSVVSCANITRIPSSTWTMHRNDLSNTGYSDDALSLPLEKVWEAQTGAKIMGSATISSDGTVYVGSNDGKLYAYDILTGCNKWTYQTGGEITGTPTVDDNNIYFGSADGRFYALQKSGTLKWSYDIGTPVYSSPKIFNSRIIIGAGNKFYVLLSADGTKLLEIETGANASYSPTIQNDLLIALHRQDYSGRFVGYSLIDGNISQVISNTSYYSSLGLYNSNYDYEKTILWDAVNNLLISYFGSGKPIVAYDTTTGMIEWSKYDANVPAFHNNLIYYGNYSSTYGILSGTGAVSWTYTPQEYYGSYQRDKINSIAKDKLIQPMGNTLMVLNADTGTLSQQITLTSTNTYFSNSPSIANGMVFIADSSGKLYAYK